ncbi:hypothetical protein O0235_03115 [Tepidiforma flava]|uniref:Uncharacterized protein n=1 Tax=Tepidiforma flava TaxID=3004094 RepID=A0ABY7M7Q6_9CHLR|nr:hypothetical protein [Tepidiforma flava]WBL36562.1 hypothetical protein O0235_03115 [Tepidiforma flava]
MNPGEAFVGFDFQGHLWFVLTGPDAEGRVVVVNITTHGRSPICARGDCFVLAPGDHPFITRESCVFWRGATFAEDAALEAARERRTLDLRPPLRMALLREMQRRVADSPYVPDRVRRAVRAHHGGAG